MALKTHELSWCETYMSALSKRIHGYLTKLQESEERCARAEARIVELEGVIAGLRAKMEILIYPENAYKEYKAK